MASTARDALAPAERLRITEVFHSLQGEALSFGLPTVFIRLTGCPLRCSYCDTEYAFHGGEWLSFDALLSNVAQYDVKHICVTGGEPLAQPNCAALLKKLCDAGYAVSLETSGAIDIAPVDTRVSRVVDLKTPASGEMLRNRWENIELLTDHDQVKFVVCDKADFDWSIDVVRRYDLLSRCTVWISPSYAQVKPKELAGWILASGLPVRMQVQLHKLIWGDEPGR